MGKITDEMKAVEPESTDQIQEEIRQTESEIADTLSTLEERLSPKRMERELADKVKEYATTSTKKVTDFCAHRPISAAMIIAAVAGGVVGTVLLVRKRRTVHLGKLHFGRQNPLARKGGLMCKCGLGRKRALAEALPHKAKKEPMKEIQKYIKIGRVAIAVISALATFLARQREAAGVKRSHPAEYPGH